MIRPRQWRPRYRLELGYFKELLILVQGRLQQIRPDSLDPGSVAAISTAPSFIKAVDVLVRRMVLNLDQANAKSWRIAANKAMRGREIHAALLDDLAGSIGIRRQQLIDEHSAKIKSLPDYLAAHAAEAFAEGQLAGRRSPDIVEQLRGTLSRLTKSHCAMLARTQVSASETAMTRARSEAIDSHWFQWSTSEDQRVRSSHKLMDKVLCNWNDLPAPEALVGVRSTLGHYAGGSCPNCRCLCLPLISLDEISWPARVFRSGQISRMSRAQFQEIYQGALVAA